MLEIEYDPLLVGISVVVAVMGAWTTLVLTDLVRDQQKTTAQKAALLINSAAVFAGSNWAMHFVAMISLGFPVAVTYETKEIVASLFLATVASGVGLFLVSQRVIGKFSNLAGGTLIGLGVVGMHYLGIEAIRGCGISADVRSVAVSATIAIVGTVTGLWLGFRKPGFTKTALGGLVVGATAAWVHYSAMYSTAFFADPLLVAVAPTRLPHSILAYAIAMAAIAVCAAQLLSANSASAKLAGGSPGIHGMRLKH